MLKFNWCQCKLPKALVFCEMEQYMYATLAAAKNHVQVLGYWALLLIPYSVENETRVQKAKWETESNK